MWGGSGAAGLQDKPRGPHIPWCPGAAGPGGLRGCHCAVITGRQRKHPPLTATLPPARHAALGAGPRGRGGACMQTPPAGREAAHARCAHGAARVLTQCTGPGSRGEEGGPRMVMRPGFCRAIGGGRGRGGTAYVKQRAGGAHGGEAAGRRGHAGGAWPTCKSCRLWWAWLGCKYERGPFPPPARQSSPPPL